MTTNLRPPIDYHELVQDDRVNSRLHTDQVIFDQEVERIWQREWLYVGHESEISSPGDFLTRKVGGQPIIFSRARDNTIHVLINRCRHRGNSLCQEERGNANLFQCNYHGWTYAGDGKLLGVPYPKGYDDSFSKDDFGLLHVPRVDSYRGFFFANFSADGEDFDTHLDPVKPYFDAWCEIAPAGELEVRGVLKHRARCNWKLPYEVGSDSYHLLSVHESVLGIVGVDNLRGTFDNAETGAMEDLGHGHNRGYMKGGPDSDAPGEERGPSLQLGESSSESQRAYVEALAARLGSTEAAMELIGRGAPSAFMVFPNLMFITDHVRVFEPVSADECVVHYYPLTLKGAPEEINQDRLRGMSFAFGPAGIIDPDDVEINERSQRGFEGTLNEWMHVSRGMQRDEQRDGLVIGHLSDEAPHRGFWRQYRELMMKDG